MNQIEKEFSAAKLWFDAIASAVGKQKLAVIRQCKDASDGGWDMLIRYLNPYVMFYIGEKSLESNIQPCEEKFDNSSQLFNVLTGKKGLTNALLAKVKSTIKSVETPVIRAFMAKYIARTVKIGVTADTVNKAIGQTVIPTFGCMLANKYFEHPKEAVGKIMAVTEKLDGIRALAIVTPSQHAGEAQQCEIRIYSRQGQPINGLCEVETAIKNAISAIDETVSYFTNSFVLDGELLITDRAGIPSKEQYKRTVKIVRTDKNENKTGITYHVFDCLPYSDFLKGICNVPYHRRRKIIEFFGQNNISQALQIVPAITHFLSDDAETVFNTVTELVAKARKDGLEGIMLNDNAAPYICARTNHLLKVKVFQDCDLEIIGFQQGAGKFADTLGALIVDYKGNRVGVGTGLTDEQRKEFWEHQNEYLGRIATIQYFEETCDSKGVLSIRFPVFVELREQGKEVSYN